MKRLARTIASTVLLSGPLAFISISGASAVEPGTLGYAYSKAKVCISDMHKGSGWRIGNSIRMWNAAQDHIFFTPNCSEGMGMLVILQYDEADGWDGYWETGDNVVWHQGPDGTWFFPLSYIYLNNHYRKPFTTNAYTKHERRCYSQHVTMHEFGHALGLAHSTVKGSVMNDTWAQKWPCGIVHPSDQANLDLAYAQRIFR